MNDLLVIAIDFFILLASLLAAFFLGFSQGFRYGKAQGERSAFFFYRLKNLERHSTHGEN